MPDITQADLRAIAEDVKGYVRERFDAADKLNDERHTDLSNKVQRINDTVIAHDRTIIGHGYELRAVGLLAKTLERKTAAAGDVKLAALTWRARAKVAGAIGGVTTVVVGVIDFVRSYGPTLWHFIHP